MLWEKQIDSHCPLVSSPHGIELDNTERHFHRLVQLCRRCKRISRCYCRLNKMFLKLSGFSFYLLCTSLFASAQSSSQNNLQVKTNTGTYIGIINGIVHDVRQFLNVPYALSPVGSRRWLPPIETTSSASTIHDATTFPLFCPQYLSAAANVYNQLIPGYLIPTGLDMRHQGPCLRPLGKTVCPCRSGLQQAMSPTCL